LASAFAGCLTVFLVIGFAVARLAWPERAVCDGLRRGVGVAFLGRRCEALAFLDRWRVLVATGFCVDLTSLARGCHPKNKAPGTGAVRVHCGSLIFCRYSTFLARIKELRRCENGESAVSPA
jgi:hypothetical protein